MLDIEFSKLCIDSDLQTVQAAVNEHGDYLLQNPDAFYRAIQYNNLPVAKWLYSCNYDLCLKPTDCTTDDFIRIVIHP